MIIGLIVGLATAFAVSAVVIHALNREITQLTTRNAELVTRAVEAELHAAELLGVSVEEYMNTYVREQDNG
jgi:septation ring formation regulator EzrA